ncbi:MAG: tetratricopeptide repeat protein [Clostridia bacterium]|nr:tetratricopeptide repeat protein [Clostridia bacterium]
MDINRIIEKLDGYLGKNDYSSAERHLLYWLSEAEKSSDFRAMLLMRNELMGLYRKLGKKDDALCCAESALGIIDAQNLSDNIGAATTYLNTATVFKAFGMAEKALPLYEKAKIIYEINLNPYDERFGGLYNNMALALVDLKAFSRADELYRKALGVTENFDGRKPEAAITYLNMANAAEAEHGLENAESIITEYLEKAIELLDSSVSETDGNYAFVCEKCASVFGYYGYFFYQKEIERRSKKIYEGS